MFGLTDQVDIDKNAVYRYAGTKNHRLHNRLNRHDTILRYNYCTCRHQQWSSRTGVTGVPTRVTHVNTD